MSCHLATLQPLFWVEARWQCLQPFSGSPPATLTALQAQHIYMPCFVSCFAFQLCLLLARRHHRMWTVAISLQLTDSLSAPGPGSCFIYICNLTWIAWIPCQKSCAFIWSSAVQCLSVLLSWHLPFSLENSRKWLLQSAGEAQETIGSLTTTTAATCSTFI